MMEGMYAKRNKMDSELLTCLLKFIVPFGIVSYAFTLFWTTFVETAVLKYFSTTHMHGSLILFVPLVT